MRTASCGIHARLHSVICHYTMSSVTGATNALDCSCLHSMASLSARFPFDTLKLLPVLPSMHMVNCRKTVSYRVVGRNLIVAGGILSSSTYEKFRSKGKKTHFGFMDQERH